jgi:hypothetical protein
MFNDSIIRCLRSHRYRIVLQTDMACLFVLAHLHQLEILIIHLAGSYIFRQLCVGPFGFLLQNAVRGTTTRSSEVETLQHHLIP